MLLAPHEKRRGAECESDVREMMKTGSKLIVLPV